ncbi:MAG: aspartate aminotransferase family protein [Pirellulales bacterium]|nr:aspartate aminotransferase family protein [Pirellulales bacterium]
MTYSGELARDLAHLIHPLHQPQAQAHGHVWLRGEGAELIDHRGQRFLDALAGLWNVLVGHGRVELAEAASRQMRELAFASAYAGSSNRPAIELAERLAGLCYPNIGKFFFTCGGAEANETAIKTARYYWKRAGHPGKYKVVSRTYAYHGTTLAAMSATGLASYWPMFEPRVPGFVHIASPYPYRFAARPGDPRSPGEQAADLLEQAIQEEGPDTVAAFLAEPVHGAGGVIVPPDDYWPRIRQICDRYQVLLIADEVITGFGRTGPWFALERYGIQPDLVTFAKGITSGYFPLGGVGMSHAIAEALDSAADTSTWMHAFTYSAHPVGCAVALANLDILQREGLRERAAELGRRLLAGLQSLAVHRHVGEVRGLGLMAAVELVADKQTRAEFPPQEQVGARVHAATQQLGMFTRLRQDVYNFAPCYVAREDQIDRMVRILGDAIEAVLGPP